MSLFKELKRRNVIRIAGIYAVVAWILMQVAGTLEESLNLPVWFDSVVTAGLMIGFPIALLLAWAFEMTPEGVKRTEELVEGETVTNSKMDGLILVGMVAVLGLGVWQQFGEKTLDSHLLENDDEGSVNLNNNPVIPAQAGIALKETPIQPNSIAVLPFKDLSPNKDQEYFSDGMAEEILNVLVRVDALKVTSRTSAFQFKGQEIGIPEIAKQLKVRYVLEGSVRKAGNNVRITAQLIVAQGDKHLWSDTFDRPLTTNNIFAIQDEISNAIVKALSKKLDVSITDKVAVEKPTENISAYQLFLKARSLFFSRSKLDEADNYLSQALKIDHNYAKAWELRSAIQSLMNEYGVTNLKQKKREALAEEYAQKALLLVPNSSLALTVIADLHIRQNQRLEAKHLYADIIRDFNHSIEINPYNPTSYNWRGLALKSVGELQAALRDFEKCTQIEPYYIACVENAISVYSELGEDEIAILKIDNALSKSLIRLGVNDLGLFARNKNYLMFKSITNQSDVLSGFKYHDELYQAFLLPTKSHQQLRQKVIKFNSINQRMSEENLSYFLLIIGGYDQPPRTMITHIWGEEFKLYRLSPQFKSYIKKSGIYDYWLEVGYPPQCKPLGEDDFECD